MERNGDGYHTWIWTPDWRREDREVPRIVYFRSECYLGELPSSAKLRITADTRYKLYVNGTLTEVGPSRGDREIWFYDIVELAPFLKVGKNVIGISVLRYPISREAGNHGMFRTEIPGLLAVWENWESGSFEALTWKCYVDRTTEFPREEIRFAPLLIHEVASGNPLIHGWLEEDFSALDRGEGERAISDCEKKDSPIWNGDEGNPAAPDRGEGDDASSGWLDSVVYPKGTMDEAIAPGNLALRTIPFMYRKKRIFCDVKAADVGSVSEQNTLDVLAMAKAMLFDGTAVQILARKRIRLVFNAGEEMTGYLTLRFAGGRDAKVTLLESEAYVSNETSPTSGTVIKYDREDDKKGHLEGYTDSYRVAGLGTKEAPEIYEPYWFRTFRFIEVTVETADEPLFILSFDYEETGYPLQVRSRVETSDPSFEKIWEISERTLRRCMHETYEDCPFYEQLQYIMDTRSQILYTYAVSSDDRLARKAIDDFSRCQRYDGLLNASYPNMNPNVIPGFSIFYILMVYDHMMYFGDEVLVRNYLPTIDKILNYFDRHRTGEGLVAKTGGVNGKARFWSFIDWEKEWNPTEGMPPAGLYGPITMESLLYVYGLQHAARLSEFVGRRDTAKEYRERAKAVQSAIRTYCIRPDGLLTDGVYEILREVVGKQDEGEQDHGRTGSRKSEKEQGVPNLHAGQLVQVFGILTGTLDEETGRRNLMQTIEESGHPRCTVATCFYLFRALEKTGLYDKTDDYWNIWRKMVRDNCTTCVESEDYARSECHAWGALALFELPSKVLGVMPAKPGYREILVSPNPGRLTSASGVVKTPVGEVQVSWHKNGEQLEIEAKGPEGIPVTVRRA